MAYVVKIDDREYRVAIDMKGDLYDIRVDDRSRRVELMHQEGDTMILHVDGTPHRIVVQKDDQIMVNDELYHVHILDEHVQKMMKASPQSMHKKDLIIKAPMPGLVIDVLVAEGDRVTKDQGLIIIEAMKMQNEMKPARDGIVKQVLVQKGQTINSGDKLIVIE